MFDLVLAPGENLDQIKDKSDWDKVKGSLMKSKHASIYFYGQFCKKDIDSLFL